MQQRVRFLHTPGSLPQTHTGAYSIESTGIQYNCSVGTAVRVAVYGMFMSMIVAACLEFAIVAVGLNGESCKASV